MHLSWSANVLSKFGWVMKSFSIAVIGHKVIKTLIKTERKATTTKIMNISSILGNIGYLQQHLINPFIAML